MTSSPPSEALEVRGKTLTPVSPKPLHFPSPSNIPILENQESVNMNPDNTSTTPGDANGPSGMPGMSLNRPGEAHPSAVPASETSLQTSPHGLPSAPIVSSVVHGSNPSEPTNAAVDFQTLLQSLSSVSQLNATPDANNMTNGNEPPMSTSTPSTAGMTGNGMSLPPRPPPQARPSTHPNYAPSDDIRSYHPHSQVDPGASYRSQAGVVSTGVGSNGLPPPPSASFQQGPKSRSEDVNPSPTTAGFPGDPQNERLSDEDIQWAPEVQKLYDEFLQAERMYVTEGQWDRFPSNSRLFIGNLPTEKVTKRDLFHVFYRHGKLAQISIKQAYGFVQFLDGESCMRALEQAQGLSVRGRPLHLEISKPQRNTNRDGGARGARRRSRSPDHARGRNTDRYTGTAGSPRHGGRDVRRTRDDYRPGRSPSPRGYRSRCGRRSPPDHYHSRRSRSRSPAHRRYRSPEPRHVDDDLPLPRRRPEQVPEVQMIVVEEVDREFIHYVERGFKDRGVKADVLILSPRLSEIAVVQRQIVEQVQAVVRLARNHQRSGRIPIQIFDLSQGVDNVRFEEYDNLEPAIAAELVIRARSTHRRKSTQTQYSYGLPPANQPTYGMPAQYGTPSQQPAPTPSNSTTQNFAQPAPGDLSSAISSLQGQDLNRLLASLQGQNQPPPAAAAQAGVPPELAQLLTQVQPAAQGQPHQSQQSSVHPMAQYRNSTFDTRSQGPPPGSSGIQPMAGTQAQPPTVNMEDLLAQLGNYKR